MYIASLLISVALAAAAPKPQVWGDWHDCLTDTSANEIATKYLAVYDSGAVTSLADLTGIVSEDFLSYDETCTGPYTDGLCTSGIQAFYDSLTATGESTVENSTQKPVFVIHSCDHIAYRWQFEGYATGYNATVPAGTYLAFKGNDIIHIDLETGLIDTAYSSGDYINLAKELGQVGSYSPFA